MQGSWLSVSRILITIIILRYYLFLNTSSMLDAHVSTPTHFWYHRICFKAYWTFGLKPTDLVIWIGPGMIWHSDVNFSLHTFVYTSLKDLHLWNNMSLAITSHYPKTLQLSSHFIVWGRFLSCQVNCPWWATVLPCHIMWSDRDDGD
jgi:hypothetical protein